MAYKFRCSACSHTFTSNVRRASCPRSHCYSGQAPTFLEEVLDIAVDVAVAYVAADIVTSVASSVVESLFDW